MTNWQQFGIDPAVMAQKPRGTSTRDWALSHASPVFRTLYKQVGAPASNGGSQLVKTFLFVTSPLGAIVSVFTPTRDAVDMFVSTWNGRGCDYDFSFGFQCEDLAQFYNRDVVHAKPLSGNAIDALNTYDKTKYTRINYTSGDAPKKGDVVVWGRGVGAYGHIAIFLSGNGVQFKSLDQNWPIGSKVHVQPHSYMWVTGWLRRK